MNNSLQCFARGAVQDSWRCYGLVEMAFSVSHAAPGLRQLYLICPIHCPHHSAMPGGRHDN